jgi:hypothetical protein
MPTSARLPALEFLSAWMLAFPSLTSAAEPVAPAAPESPPPANELGDDRPTTPVTPPDGPVRLAGANGRVVDFAGIWEARPEGLVVVTQPADPLTLVPWDKFDLARLHTEQPGIDAARQRAVFLRSPQPVNLGLFAGLLTPVQAGLELRRLLDFSLTAKVPFAYRTTTQSSSATTVVPARPVIYNGLILNPGPDAVQAYAQTGRTVSETRFSPDELTTSPRRVLDVLSRTDGVAAADRRELFELVKVNPLLLEQIAGGLERVAASLPPRHLLPNDPVLVTLALRLRDFAAGLRRLTTASGIDYSDQVMMRDLLLLADHPVLR